MGHAALPTMSVNLKTYEVCGGRQLPTREPADVLALASGYSLS
jgi:hypothetical protein